MNRYIVILILALAGLGLLLYPMVSSWLYGRDVAAEKQEFLKHTQDPENSGDDPSPYEELYRFLKAENERLYLTGQAGLVDAFSYQTAGIDLSEYGIEDGCIAYIEIPSINIEAPVYLGANTENMSKGAVHLTQTSYPVGGENTNAVIAAHRGGVREMFRNIHKIKLGDEIIITNFRETLVYRASEIKIILPGDIDDVKIQEGRDLVTLLSCNPLGQNYQRYCLYCERAPIDESDEQMFF